MNLKEFSNPLSRQEMKQIFGGNQQQLALDGSYAACSASCPDGTIKTCSGGPYCEATDGVGCYSGTEDKKC